MTQAIEAPADYAALFEQYFPYMRALARRMGVHRDDAEDAASSVMVRLLERDFLALYDPTTGVTFKRFLTATVCLYLRGHRERLQRDYWREPRLLDVPVETSADDAHGDLLLVAVDGPESGVVRQLAYEAMVRGLQAFLTNDADRTLLALVARQIHVLGESIQTLLAEPLGVSRTTAHTRVTNLKRTLSKAVGAPPPRLRGGGRRLRHP